MNLLIATDSSNGNSDSRDIDSSNPYHYDINDDSNDSN